MGITFPPGGSFFAPQGDFFVGVPQSLFRPFAAEQRRRNWCWAACVQMILNWHGVTVSQREVVERIFGAPIDLPGNVPQILEALSGLGPHLSGRPASIEARLACCLDHLLADLRDDQLILAGLSRPGAIGHAYVLCGITYDQLPGRPPQPVSVILWNPDPFAGGWQEMTWAEFNARKICLIRCRVCPLVRNL
jgi:hypothetical protein